jgi:serine phosphatase RsbU (regulator of sigma subunit)
MSETAATAGGEPGAEPAPESRSHREARAAIAFAAELYLIGAALCATAALLPDVSSPAAVVAVAVTAVITAGVLLLAFYRRSGSLLISYVADLWGVVLIAILCASTGGASSPFALLYFFAIGHAAAFQPRARFAIVCFAGLVAFLLPVAYSEVSTAFAAVACVGIVLAVLAAGVVHFALNRMREQRGRLELLIAATASLESSLDPAQTLHKIADTAVPELADLCVIDLLERGSIATTVVAASDPTIAAGVERLREAVPLDPRGPHLVARVLATGEPYVVDNLTDAAALREIARSEEHERFMRDAGYRSAAVFPMVARGRTRGAISFVHVGSDRPFRRSLLEVQQDFSGRAAMAFDNARLYAERDHVARTLRRSLMPAVLPVIPGLELASFFRPRGAGDEVGGDFYDAFGDRTGVWLVVGDVCGKGAEAAALTGFLRHTTIAYARESAGPGTVLAKVNQAMMDQDFAGQFATAILVRLGFLRDGVKLTLAAAGHPAALLVRLDGQVEEFGDRGTLLGVFSDPVIEEVSTVLAPGDALALYTDGLADAHAPDRTITAQEMIERIRQHPPRLAQDAIDALLELVDLDGDVRDDIAILAAQVTAGNGRPGQSPREPSPRGSLPR